MIDLSGDLTWHGDNAHIHSMMGGIDINADMGPIMMYSDWLDINAYSGVNINGNTNISGDVSGSNAPTNADHLTRKDYVDAADAALMNSINNLDSTTTANALWQDDGNGNITNTNIGEVQLAGGVSAGYVMTGFVDAGHVMTGHLNTMGDAWIEGNAIGLLQPTQNEHLTRKDYVDVGDMNNAASIMNAEMNANTAITAETVRATAAEAANATAITTEETRATAAEAALMNSINNLDSTTTANALWQDDGNGNITNTNIGEVQLAGGVSAGYVMTGFVDAGHVMTGHLNTMGDAWIEGNAIGLLQPTQNEHLTRKDYVDVGDMNNAASIMNAEMNANTAITAETVRATAAEAANATAITTEETRATAAEAALMNSINNLDSTTTANALWSDDGMGNITNSNSGNTNIGDGFMGVNVNSVGDYIDLNGSIIDIGHGMGGVHVDFGNTNIGDGSMGVNVSSDGDMVDIHAISTNINGELNVSGNLYAGGTLLSSDRRFKKDIITVNNALDKVLQLRGVYYYWRQKDFPNKNFDDKKELGLIAQEVESIIPEIVGESVDGYKAVEYQKLVALLIEAIKEQQAIIDGQKTEMADMRVELDGRLKALEEMFNTATLNK